MSLEKTTIPNALLQLSQRFEKWRKANPPRTRLPEPLWEAAVEMAHRHGLHRTSKMLRVDYMQLKKRLPPAAQPARPPRPAFFELLAAPAPGPVECVVELESATGRMRVAMKGAALDWASLLQAWREAR